ARDGGRRRPGDRRGPADHRGAGGDAGVAVGDLVAARPDAPRHRRLTKGIVLAGWGPVLAAVPETMMRPATREGPSVDCAPCPSRLTSRTSRSSRGST